MITNALVCNRGLRRAKGSRVGEQLALSVYETFDKRGGASISREFSSKLGVRLICRLRVGAGIILVIYVNSMVLATADDGKSATRLHPFPPTQKSSVQE